MDSRVCAGLMGEASMTVGSTDTAEYLGSGDVRVLATPRLIALMEAATCAALLGALPLEETSVGTHVNVEHLAPSNPGFFVTASAEVIEVSGRRVRFRVTATHTLASGESNPVGRGTITRVVVDRSRFPR